MAESKLRKLKKMYQHRDRVARGLTEDGHFRIGVVRSSSLASRAQERHGLGPLAAVILGRAMSGAALLASFLKGEERIIIEIKGSGPLGLVYAEAMQVGEIRGFVGNPTATIDMKADNAQLGDGLGLGLMQVSKILYDRGEPTTGITDLAKGDISADLEKYLLQSEQIRSSVVLDERIDDEGKMVQAGGILVQAMPDADPEQIETIVANITELRSRNSSWMTDYRPDEVIQMIAGENVKIVANTPIDFYCRCSIERFKNGLLTLGRAEIEDMWRKKQRELVCNYCSERYELSDDDFSGLIDEIDAQSAGKSGGES